MNINPLRKDSKDAQLILEIAKVMMNFDYAGRLNTVAMIKDYFDNKGYNFKYEVLSHTTHNSLLKQNINNKDYLFPRKQLFKK